MVMKKFYWFGDSWVFGDELEKLVPCHNVTQYNFAGLVSSHFNAECVNLSECGSSITTIPLKFYEILEKINPDVDRVFFGLTASHRTAMFDDSGNYQNILPSLHNKHKPHKHQDKWFKYFDSQGQRTYNYDCITNLLYFWCQQKNIKCYFLNLFTTETVSLINSIPDDAWLVSKDQCTAQFILELVDNQNQSVITDDSPNLTNDQWAIQSKLVEKYIKPCYAHPNIHGHKVIADNLIKLLENKL
jgi:hypothetical protein